MSKYDKTSAKRAFFALLGDRPVAYHPMLAHVLGDVKQALFVSQLLYWHDRGKLPDGWIWKTQADLTRETGLSRYEQEAARKRLIKKGVLEEKLQGVPATLHYRLNLDVLYQLVEEYLSDQEDQQQSTSREPPKSDCEEATDQIAEKPQSRLRKNPNLDCGKTPNQIAEKPHTISENTPETTTETTAAARPAQKSEPEPPNPNQNGDFAQALRAYQNSFGPLGNSFKYQKFQMLWDEYPVLEVHEYARQEMYEAMMDDKRRVHPNLNYYAQCLATGKARASPRPKQSPKRSHGGPDMDDPAIQEWIAKYEAGTLPYHNR